MQQDYQKYLPQPAQIQHLEQRIADLELQLAELKHAYSRPPLPLGAQADQVATDNYYNMHL